MRAIAAVSILALAACGPSAVVKRAQTLIDAGDYAGAAQLTAAELDKNPRDGDLWRIRMRAALGQHDARAAVGYYAAWRGVHGSDDSAAMKMLAMTTIWQALESPAPQAQVEAIQVVERLEIERLGDAVADQMADDDDIVAAAAAIAILKAYPQAPSLATEMLASDDPVARAIAAEGIGRKIGARAADDLRPLLDDEDAAVRRIAVRALAAIADPADTDRLVKAAGDADAEVRAAALSALARGERGDHAKLARTLLENDDHLGVRLAAIDLLAASGDHDGLVSLLACKEPEISIHAARLLAREFPVEAEAALECASGSPDWTVRAAALNASQSVMKKDAWRRFAHMKLDDDDLRVRLAAARLLGDDAAALAIFTEALGQDDTRLGAAIDLARIEDPRGLTTLGELVVSPDPATRRGAAAGYQQAHHVDGGLVPALADDDPLVRIIAAASILAL
jgi:HEAT repeat protein